MLDELHRPAADVDTYVIESVGHLREAGIDPVAFARRHTLLLLKPDAIVARAVEPALRWLDEGGYRVVHAERITADRHLARAMWRTSWITASAERRRLADLLVGVCDALVLLITDADGAGSAAAEPVSVRLTREKGATDPRRRRPGDLRHALGVHSHLLNLVHTPDDPFDVLRELAIVFDERARARVLAALPGGDGAARAADLARALYADAPARDFGRAEAHRRILSDVRAGGGAPPAETGDPDADAVALLECATAPGIAADPWSVIVLGSHVLPLSAPNPLLDTTNGDAAIPPSRIGGSDDDQ